MTSTLDVIKVIEAYAPLDLAEEWDHPGLAFGSYEAEIKRVFLALDLRPEIVEEAIKTQADLLLLHHPPLFNAIHEMTDATPEGKMQLDLIRNNISVYSAHTNLDRCLDGTAAALTLSLDLDVDEVGYQVLQPLEGRPDYGYGLYANLKEPQSFLEFAELIAQRLEIPACQRFTSTNRQVRRISLFPGSFDASCIARLEEIKSDVLITGEIKHHVALMLEARGVNVLAVGHDVSERDVMLLLAAHLHTVFPDLRIEVDAGIDYN